MDARKAQESINEYLSSLPYRASEFNPGINPPKEGMYDQMSADIDRLMQRVGEKTYSERLHDITETNKAITDGILSFTRVGAVKDLMNAETWDEYPR
jgi:hypothetical protein